MGRKKLVKKKKLAKTCFKFDTIHDKGMFVTNDRVWKNRIGLLESKFPGIVEVVKKPDKEDNMLYAKLPKSWFKITPSATIEGHTQHDIKSMNSHGKPD